MSINSLKSSLTTRDLMKTCCKRPGRTSLIGGNGNSGHTPANAEAGAAAPSIIPALSATEYRLVR